MRLINSYRIKAFIAGLFLNVFFWWGWWYVSKGIYNELSKIVNNDSIVDLNVYGLVVPVGAIGICIISLILPSIALIYNKPFNLIWGHAGTKIINYVVGGFALFGFITAVVSYKWAEDQFEVRGYSYCKSMSRISAMGRHEVYVARQELCVNPKKK